MIFINNNCILESSQDSTVFIKRVTTCSAVGLFMYCTHFTALFFF